MIKTLNFYKSNLFPGFPVHLRDLQLQGEEVGPLGDDAAGRVHGRLH
jgi:hypothetical protein